MVTHFRIARSLATRLQDLGVSPEDVLRHGGLSPRLFDQEKAQVTTEELFAFYRGLEAVSGDPAIGLSMGTEYRLERYDALALAAVSAHTLRDALARLARYKQMFVPEELRLTERGPDANVRFRWLLAEETEPPLLIDLCFSWIVAIAHRGSDGFVRPKRIELRGPSRHGRMHEEHFGCPVRFKARANTIVFARTDLDRPFVTYNAELLAALAPHLEAELEKARTALALTDQVKAILKRQLAGRRPVVDDVAHELNLSPRTLQRRLTEDGSSFQALLREARRELARHYLLHSGLELKETAYLLGYEDAPSFHRAFQQWEGSPPGEWRTQHVQAV